MGYGWSWSNIPRGRKFSNGSRKVTRCEPCSELIPDRRAESPWHAGRVRQRVAAGRRAGHVELVERVARPEAGMPAFRRLHPDPKVELRIWRDDVGGGLAEIAPGAPHIGTVAPEDAAELVGERKAIVRAERRRPLRRITELGAAILDRLQRDVVIADEGADLRVQVGHRASQRQPLCGTRGEVQVEAIGLRFRNILDDEDAAQKARGDGAELLVLVVIVEVRGVEREPAVEETELRAGLVRRQFLLLHRNGGGVQDQIVDQPNTRLEATTDEAVDQA